MTVTLTPVMPAFKIGGVIMPTPTDVQWEFPKAIGRNGLGLERLEPFTSCTLTWNLMQFNDYTTLRDAYDALTGTTYVQLPAQYGNVNSAWIMYSGVIVDIPRIEGAYFESRPLNIKMKISKISVART